MSVGNKIIIIIFLILVIFGIGFAIFSFFGHNLIPGALPTAILNNHRIEMVIAKTQKDKEIGLSAYKRLPINQGMLFPFGKADYYSFWMRNMKFPIDIVYLNNKKIVKIYENVKPPLGKNASLPIYISNSPADTVLEINAGLSKKYNLKVGDKITYENFSS